MNRFVCASSAVNSSVGAPVFSSHIDVCSDPVFGEVCSILLPTTRWEIFCFLSSWNVVAYGRGFGCLSQLRKSSLKIDAIKILLSCFLLCDCRSSPTIGIQTDVRTRLGVDISEVSGPSVFHIKVGRPAKCLAQEHNKRICRVVLHNVP